MVRDSSLDPFPGAVARQQESCDRAEKRADEYVGDPLGKAEDRSPREGQDRAGDEEYGGQDVETDEGGRSPETQPLDPECRLGDVLVADSGQAEEEGQRQQQEEGLAVPGRAAAAGGPDLGGLEVWRTHESPHLIGFPGARVPSRGIRRGCPHNSIPPPPCSRNNGRRW